MEATRVKEPPKTVTRCAGKEAVLPNVSCAHPTEEIKDRRYFRTTRLQTPLVLILCVFLKGQRVS